MWKEKYGEITNNGNEIYVTNNNNVTNMWTAWSMKSSNDNNEYVNENHGVIMKMKNDNDNDNWT
jgi:hypothetical protein